MNKYLTLLIIILSLAFFSCNRKSIYMTNRELKETFERVDKIILDTSAYTSSQLLTYDTSNTLLSFWSSEVDTSDVIVRYIFSWEEGEIKTVTGKMVHPRLIFGFARYDPYNVHGTNFFKVSNGVWIPIEWPKNIIDIYIRPKE